MSALFGYLSTSALDSILHNLSPNSTIFHFQRSSAGLIQLSLLKKSPSSSSVSPWCKQHSYLARVVSRPVCMDVSRLSVSITSVWSSVDLDVCRSPRLIGSQLSFIKVSLASRQLSSLSQIRWQPGREQSGLTSSRWAEYLRPLRVESSLQFVFLVESFKERGGR